jgi:hypothetical protein
MRLFTTLMTDATVNVVQHSDGIGQWTSTNRAQHTQWTPAVNKYNHAPRLANHNRRTWLSSHDTPAASAPSGGGSNQFRNNKVCMIFVTGLEFHSGIATCITSKAKETYLVMTYKLVYPFFWNWTSPQWNWFPAFLHKWPRNARNELPS